MARKSKIRYSAKDKQKLRQIQQQVNNRIRYQRNKGGDVSHLPETIKIADLEKSIYSRADYNFQISQMEKMLKKDALKKVVTNRGYELTQGEVAQTRNAQRRENIKRTIMRKQQREIDLEQGRLLGSDFSSAHEKREFDIMNANPEYIEKQIERINRMSSDLHDIKVDKMYKDNYIKSLLNVYSSQDENGNYLIDEELQSVIEKIDSMDAGLFMNKARRDDRFQVGFNYTPIGTLTERYENLLDLWEVN